MDLYTLETFDAETSPLENIVIDLTGDDTEPSEDGSDTYASIFGEDEDISADGAPDTGFPFEVADDFALRDTSDGALSSHNGDTLDQDVEMDFDDHADDDAEDAIDHDGEEDAEDTMDHDGEEDAEDTMDHDGEEDAEDTMDHDGEEDADSNFGELEDADPSLYDEFDFGINVPVSHSVSDFCLRGQALEDSDPGLFAKFVLTGHYTDDLLDRPCQAVVEPLRNALNRDHPITALRDYDSLLGYVADLPIAAPIYVAPVGNAREVLRRSVHISVLVDTADVSLFVSFFLKKISDLLGIFRALKRWTFIGSLTLNLDPGAKGTPYGCFFLGFMTGTPTLLPS
jgi:hypothetical protein